LGAQLEKGESLMKYKLVRPLMMLFVALLFGLALALVWGVALDPAPAQADGAVSYVDDDTCPATGSGTEGDPFCRIQDAVDAASDGDEIRVASGTYTGTQMVLDSRTGYTFTQVVFITRSLTLRGGYDAADWSAEPDPAANRTVIDAQGYGRGISLVGQNTDTPEVTLEGLTITGGDYTGLGNPPGGGWQVCHEDEGIDCGGGLYATWSHFVLRNCIVRDNTAGPNDESHGGGIYIYMIPPEGPGIRIENSAVISNSAPAFGGQGGGMFADGIWQPITVTQSTFQENYAQDRGGGVKLYNNSDRLFIQDTNFLSNTASSGSGAHIPTSFDGGAVWIERTRFQNNQTSDSGTTLYLETAGWHRPKVWLTNLLFSGNSSPYGSVIWANNNGYTSLDVNAAHVTAADNEAPTFLDARGSGLIAGRGTTVTLTNTLLVSFTNGFSGLQWDQGELLIQHSHTLTHEVTSLHHIAYGLPTFTAIDGVSGDPMLDETYHLQADSAAIDAGVDAGVDHDIDGDLRPLGDGFDIGADEFVYYKIYLPLVLR
jgi:hypothetical protein